MEKYLKKDSLINNGVYLINARNSIIGVWQQQTDSFIVTASTFNETYLHQEEHWDNSYTNGTAQPLKYLNMQLNDVDINTLINLRQVHQDEFDSLIQTLGITEQ